MSDITSSKAKIQVEACRQRAATSEFLAQTIGGSINWALDNIDSNAAAISAINSTLSGKNGVSISVTSYTQGQTLTTASNQYAIGIDMSASSGTTFILGASSSYAFGGVGQSSAMVFTLQSL